MVREEGLGTPQTGTCAERGAEGAGCGHGESRGGVNLESGGRMGVECGRWILQSFCLRRRLFQGAPCLGAINRYRTEHVNSQTLFVNIWDLEHFQNIKTFI